MQGQDKVRGGQGGLHVTERHGADLLLFTAFERADLPGHMRLTRDDRDHITLCNGEGKHTTQSWRSHVYHPVAFPGPMP